jgi:hypothetical protein
MIRHSQDKYDHETTTRQTIKITRKRQLQENLKEKTRHTTLVQDITITITQKKLSERVCDVV